MNYLSNSKKECGKSLGEESYVSEDLVQRLQDVAAGGGGLSTGRARQA